MTLEDFALISRDDAKAYIGIEDDDRDDAIDDLINAASRWIIDTAEQEFAPSIDDETRRIEYRGDGLISVVPYSLRSVSEVSIDPDDSATAPSAYRLRSAPKGRRAGVHSAIVLSGRYAAAGGVAGVGFVDVTGDWGWAAVPADIARACRRLVEMWFTAEIAFASDGYEGDQVRVPMGVPLDVRDLVESYRQTRIGAS